MQGKHTSSFLLLSLSSSLLFFSSFRHFLLSLFPFPFLSFSLHLAAFCRVLGGVPWEDSAPVVVAGRGRGQPALASTLVCGLRYAARGVCSKAVPLPWRLSSLEYSILKHA